MPDSIWKNGDQETAQCAPYMRRVPRYLFALMIIVTVVGISMTVARGQNLYIPGEVVHEDTKEPVQQINPTIKLLTPPFKGREVTMLTGGERSNFFAIIDFPTPSRTPNFITRGRIRYDVLDEGKNNEWFAGWSAGRGAEYIYSLEGLLKKMFSALGGLAYFLPHNSCEVGIAKLSWKTLQKSADRLAGDEEATWEEFVVEISKMASGAVKTCAKYTLENVIMNGRRIPISLDPKKSLGFYSAIVKPGHGAQDGLPVTIEVKKVGALRVQLEEKVDKVRSIPESCQSQQSQLVKDAEELIDDLLFPAKNFDSGRQLRQEVKEMMNRLEDASTFKSPSLTFAEEPGEVSPNGQVQTTLNVSHPCGKKAVKSLKLSIPRLGSVTGPAKTGSMKLRIPMSPPAPSGEHTITATLTHKTGKPLTATSTVAVKNEPPTITSVQQSGPARPGKKATFTIGLKDPNALTRKDERLTIKARQDTIFANSPLQTTCRFANGQGTCRLTGTVNTPLYDDKTYGKMRIEASDQQGEPADPKRTVVDVGNVHPGKTIVTPVPAKLDPQVDKQKLQVTAQFRDRNTFKDFERIRFQAEGTKGTSVAKPRRVTKQKQQITQNGRTRGQAQHTWTVHVNDGEVKVTVKVHDEQSNATGTAVVPVVNAPPKVEAVGIKSPVCPNDSTTATVMVKDENGAKDVTESGSVTASLNGGKAKPMTHDKKGSPDNPHRAIFEITLNAPGKPGKYPIKVKASDGKKEDTLKMTLVVLPCNDNGGGNGGGDHGGNKQKPGDIFMGSRNVVVRPPYATETLRLYLKGGSCVGPKTSFQATIPLDQGLAYSGSESGMTETGTTVAEFAIEPNPKLRGAVTPVGQRHVQLDLTNPRRQMCPNAQNEIPMGEVKVKTHSSGEVTLGFRQASLGGNRLETHGTRLRVRGTSGMAVLNALRLSPNPMAIGQSARLLVEGERIERVELNVFDLSGRQVLHEQSRGGQPLSFRPVDQNGSPLANGVYLYRATVFGPNGKPVRSEIRKLVVLR